MGSGATTLERESSPRRILRLLRTILQASAGQRSRWVSPMVADGGLTGGARIGGKIRSDVRCRRRTADRRAVEARVTARTTIGGPGGGMVKSLVRIGGEILVADPKSTSRRSARTPMSALRWLDSDGRRRDHPLTLRRAHGPSPVGGRRRRGYRRRLGERRDGTARGRPGDLGPGDRSPPRHAHRCQRFAPWRYGDAERRRDRPRAGGGSRLGGVQILANTREQVGGEAGSVVLRAAYGLAAAGTGGAGVRLEAKGPAGSEDAWSWTAAT